VEELWVSASENPVVTAARALTQIARSPEGAQAVVDANVLDVLPERLNSENKDVRECIGLMLAALASHECGLKRILDSNLCAQLVLLLRWVSFLRS
jgi:hypothetical protein